MTSQDPHARAPIVAAFSPQSEAREPVEFALAASRVTGAPLIIVAVQQGPPLVHDLAGDIDEATRRLGSTLEQRGVHDVDIRVFTDSTAARGLARAMDELNPELIVLGATRRGAVGTVLQGTTVDRVLHASVCPVAIVPSGYERPEAGIQVIGAAFTSTPEGREALQAAAALARAGRARLRAITVISPEHAAEQSHGLMADQHREVSPTEAQAARARLSSEAALAQAVSEVAEGLDVDIDVMVSDAADGLVAAAAFVDLLVMGSRGLGPKRAVLLGSVSRKVAGNAACPVLVLPRGADEQREALLANAEEKAREQG